MDAKKYIEEFGLQGISESTTGMLDEFIQEMQSSEIRITIMFSAICDDILARRFQSSDEDRKVMESFNMGYAVPDVTFIAAIPKEKLN